MDSLHGVSVQNDKFKIMILVGLSYIKKHFDETKMMDSLEDADHHKCFLM